jgi:hypothetical protein
MNELARRKSPWLEDVRIIFLGVFGFIRQCIETCFRSAERPHE